MEDNSKRCWVMSARCCFFLAVAEQEMWMSGPLLSISGWSQTTPACLVGLLQHRLCKGSADRPDVITWWHVLFIGWIQFSYFLGRILVQRHVPLHWMCWSSFPGNWTASRSVCSRQPAALKGICVSEVVWGDSALNKILSAETLEQLTFKIIFKKIKKTSISMETESLHKWLYWYRESSNRLKGAFLARSKCKDINFKGCWLWSPAGPGGEIITLNKITKNTEGNQLNICFSSFWIDSLMEPV